MNKYRKFLIAIGATVTLLASAMADNIITSGEWAAVGISLIGALGVLLVKNVDNL